MNTPNIKHSYANYRTSAMLTEFSLSNFKSYKDSRLPLGPLTVLIGANASGKSNIIEGLRFLSWLAEGRKLSSIQYLVNSADSDQVIRGRISDLCHREESSFSLGCCLDSTEWNQLSITISVLDGEMKIIGEHVVNSSGLELYGLTSLSALHFGASNSPSAVMVKCGNLNGDEIDYFVALDNRITLFVQLELLLAYRMYSIPGNKGNNYTSKQLDAIKQKVEIVVKTVDEY